MIDIEIKAKKTIEFLERLPENISNARRRALGKTASVYRAEVRKQIETEAGDAWPEPHPATVQFFRKYLPGISRNWTRRRHFRAAFDFLGKFARYQLYPSGKTARVSFSKAADGRPDKYLVEIAERVEKGSRQTITPAMRRMFGASRALVGRHPEPGVDFFPLKKSTKEIVTPARRFIDRAYSVVEPKTKEIFENKFFQRLEK